MGSHVIGLLSVVAGCPLGSGILAVATPAGALPDDVTPAEDPVGLAALMPDGGVKSCVASASAEVADDRSDSGISAESLIPSRIPRMTLRLPFCGSSFSLPEYSSASRGVDACRELDPVLSCQNDFTTPLLRAEFLAACLAISMQIT